MGLIYRIYMHEKGSGILIMHFEGGHTYKGFA